MANSEQVAVVCHIASGGVDDVVDWLGCPVTADGWAAPLLDMVMRLLGWQGVARAVNQYSTTDGGGRGQPNAGRGGVK